MAKLTNFKTQQVEFPTHYTIEETNRGENIKSIIPAYGTVREQGTPETSEIYNGLQLGGVHSIRTNKLTLLNIDYYNCVLDGLNDFGVNDDLKLRITIDSENQNSGAKLRLNDIDYILLKETNTDLSQLEVGDLKSGRTYDLIYNNGQFVVMNLIPTATDTTAGIVRMGTTDNTALEGKRLAEIIGLEFGGNIQDRGEKIVGNFYYDEANKSYYECTANNNLNYNESTKFRAISNKPILDKVENINKFDVLLDNPIDFGNWKEKYIELQHPFNDSKYAYYNVIVGQGAAVTNSITIIRSQNAQIIFDTYQHSTVSRVGVALADVVNSQTIRLRMLEGISAGDGVTKIIGFKNI